MLTENAGSPKFDPQHQGISMDQARLCTPALSTQRQRWEDQKFKVITDYIESSKTAKTLSGLGDDRLFFFLFTAADKQWGQ